MMTSDFVGKTVTLFYKSNEEQDLENPSVKILGVIEDFGGLYVEFDDGNKEVVSFSEITGWRELEGQ